MPSPYEYYSGAVNPTDAMLKSLGAVNNVTQQLGAGQQTQMDALKLAQGLQQQQIALQQRQQMFQLLGQAFQPGDQTQVWGALAGMMDPAAYKALNDHFTTLNQNQQQDTLLNAGQTWSALMNGRPETAQALIQSRIDALKNSNGDPGQIAFLTDLQKQAAENPQKAAAQLGVTLGALPGGKDYIDAWYKQGALPSENDQREADADQKKADAEFKRGTLDAEAAYKNALAAQANASAALDVLKAKYPGQVPPQDRPRFENDLRQEYNTQTAQFRNIRGYYQNILTSPTDKTASGASDISLIYNYMKLLDPTSVVREGEFQTAAAAGGLPSNIQAMYNSIVGQGKLGDKQRTEIMVQARKIYEAQAQNEKTVRDGLTRIGKAQGLDTDNLFYQPGGPAEPTVKVDF